MSFNIGGKENAKMTPAQMNQINTRIKDCTDAAQRLSGLAKHMGDLASQEVIIIGEARWEELFKAWDSAFQAVEHARKRFENDFERITGTNLPGAPGPDSRT
jgi:hypothetical protein